MGFKLRREVRDLLPPGLLTASERCLVLEIADACGDDTREGWPGVAWLAEAADIPEAKVGETLCRVAKKWVELRQPLGVGRDGRAYYSKPGQRTTFRVPAVDELDTLRKAPQNGVPPKAPQNGGPKGTQTGGPKAPQNRGQRPPKTGDPFPQRTPQEIPQDNTSSLGMQSPSQPPGRDRSPARETDGRESLAELTHAEGLRRVARRGFNDEQTRYLVDHLTVRYRPATPAWWRELDENGTLADRIAEAIERRQQAEAVAGWQPYRNDTSDEDYAAYAAGLHREPAA